MELLGLMIIDQLVDLLSGTQTVAFSVMAQATLSGALPPHLVPSSSSLG